MSWLAVWGVSPLPCSGALNRTVVPSLPTHTLAFLLPPVVSFLSYSLIFIAVGNVTYYLLLVLFLMWLNIRKSFNIAE